MKIKKMIIKIILMIFEFFENNTNSIKEYGKNETIKDLLIFEDNKNEENNESYQNKFWRCINPEDGDMNGIN